MENSVNTHHKTGKRKNTNKADTIEITKKMKAETEEDEKSEEEEQQDGEVYKIEVI